MIVYQIKLPKKQDAEVFLKFMQGEYFPAVGKNPTRAGQVIDLTLLQGRSADKVHEFLLHVGWSGVPGADIRIENKTVLRKFDSFSARVKRIGDYEPVAKSP